MTGADASNEEKEVIMTTIVTRALAHRRATRLALAAVALSVAAFAGSLLSADKAAAGFNSRFPFCVYNQFDRNLDCSHYTWEECQFSANGLGYCRANPFYAGPPARTVGYHKRPHH